jgi:uncharacterized protein DUF5605/uncharacterized protein DUF5060/uncharacterized protein DUF4038
MSEAAVATVERWCPFEMSLEGPDDRSMYRSEPVTAVFSTANRDVSVRGFYDGNGRFTVRFMPDTIGEWSYRISAGFGADDVTGGFTCTEATAGNHGPVRADGARFVYADGTEYFPFGTTCYAWIHQPLELQEQTLRTLKSSPFNKLRMCVFPKHYLYNENEPLHPVVGTAGPGPADGELDFDSFNPEFFRLLDQRIVELGRLGIEVDLILYHAYDRWGYATMTPEQDDRYLRYLVARTAAFRNVWWSFANEYDLMEEKAIGDWDRFFRIVQAEDPAQHLRSIHNCRAFYDHGKPWVTHCSVQHMETGRVPEWLAQYGKPVVIDECRYEGDIHKGWGNITAMEMNHKFWESVCRGGYGGHGETYVHPDDVLWWAKGGTLHGQSPERVGFLKSIVADAPSDSWAPLSHGNEWSTIGCEDEFMLTYFGHAQPSYWPMTLPADAEYSVDVIDTWEMTTTALPDAYSGECRVPLPGKPHCALRVRRR